MNFADLVEIRPLGDAAVIVQLGTGEGAANPTIEDVLRVRRSLERASIPAVHEITNAFTTVCLFYDPARVGGGGASMFAFIEEHIRSALSEAPDDVSTATAEPAVHDIPVCYEAEFALDLVDVARHCGIAVDEVVRLHSSAEYRVACVGFTPGFPYLSGLPPQLATPRRATPRTTLPAGSVAIGGTQTGIYPMSSPGGWQIIGRTPWRLFDAAGASPALLGAGDRVRFHSISAGEFRTASANPRQQPVQASANK